MPRIGFMQHETGPQSQQQNAPKQPARNHPRVNWVSLTYYVGVPLFVALYAGMNNWEIRHAAGTLSSLSYYAGHAFLPWWTTCTFTYLAMRGLERWKPPWAAILFLGHATASILVVPYSNWLTSVYEASLPELGLQHAFTDYFTTDFWGYFFRAGIIWFGINFLFDRFLKLPLYRYEVPRGYDEKTPEAKVSDAELQTAQAGWGGNVPSFMMRLPRMLEPEEILFIKAEQHYIKVATPNKNYMVLYRFSDAINEINPQLGQQVHRSYWVNTKAISAVHAKAKDFYVVMSNDEQIPVSGPYQGMVRELARSAGLPLKN